MKDSPSDVGLLAYGARPQDSSTVTGVPHAPLRGLVWAAKSREYLGIVPPDAASGVLQDVHWSAGLLGYFPTYAIGNMISVQLFEAAPKTDDYAALLSWLRENVHPYKQEA